jgi:hypothetical protein
MTARPKRRAIPMAVKRAVAERQNCLCKCGCRKLVMVTYGRRAVFMAGIHFDHQPALRLRDVNAAGTDYDPPQHSARHIDARCAQSHRVKTSGAGASIAGSDLGKIVKERRRGRPQKPKRTWPLQKVNRTGKASSGLVARSGGKIPSRPFPKVHRPMRSKP